MHRPTHLKAVKQLALLVFLLLVARVADAQQLDLGSGSVVETVRQLRPGQYVWAPEIAPEGPVLLIVNVSRQRAVLYRNGLPIGASTVSTGRPGYRTPTGVFTILQKKVEHYSSTYDNAPMPYMQRLTWRGVALHAGHLPGYPASHGCIRLPAGFAKLLFGVTRVGMTVMITDEPATPRLAPPFDIAQVPSEADSGNQGRIVWQPERSPKGPVSIVVSVADQRAVILRNGRQIGSAPVNVAGPVSGTWAYALRSIDSDGQHWIRMSLSAEPTVDQLVPREEWKRFEAPEQFKRAVAALVEPGTTIVVTADSLMKGATGAALTIIEAGRPN
jgi:L,D-transpeptidase-like protein